jgi:1-acyl-sn-glycerol-3-phosphate acyltransferase
LSDKYLFSGSRLVFNTVIPGYILGISGFLMLLLTIYQFKQFSGELPVSATPPEKIIQRGVFTVWRHPIYLFATVMLTGIALIMRSKALLFIVFPVFIVLVVLYIIREEAILVKRFGDQYIKYKRNVPLLVPRLRHWLAIPGFILLKSKFRIKVRNRENLPSSLPFIVISGHRHYLDPIIISFAVPMPLTQIATFEMFRNPLNRRLFTWFGAIPRKRFLKDMEGTRRILSTLRSGYPICMFPEGGRSWTGRLRAFKPEAIKLLKYFKDIPVLPVRIEGNYHSWPRWANHMMRSDITVTIEKPLLIDPDTSVDDLEKTLRELVEPNEEIERKNVCKGKNRIENLSKVIYRCPVCMNSDPPDEVIPDSLYCSKCKTRFILQPDFSLDFTFGNIKKTETIHTLYDHIKIKYSDIYNMLSENLANKYSHYMNPGERLIYLSPCQLWTETKNIYSH